VLGAKLALVLVMLVLAAYNRVRVTPQLARPPALRTLRHSGGIEVAIGAAVVVLAASLGTMAPPEPDGRHDHGVTSLPAPEGVAITPMQPQRRDEPLDPLRVAVYR
jgi:hypothetical protein